MQRRTLSLDWQHVVQPVLIPLKTYFPTKLLRYNQGDLRYQKRFFNTARGFGNKAGITPGKELSSLTYPNRPGHTIEGTHTHPCASEGPHPVVSSRRRSEQLRRIHCVLVDSLLSQNVTKPHTQYRTPNIHIVWV